jgi:thiamine biosynthesis lipoprotein
MVNAGGDMVMLGLPAGQATWQIGIEDPRQPGEVLAAIGVPPGAVATSSVTRRTWKQGEKQRHHLIDPRTGEPAESDWLSVTVYSPHADLSEVFAKALLIAGPNEAPGIASDVDGISYLAVDREGKLWGPQESLELIHEH